MSCNFTAPVFGASYPDACCIDGMLWDLDSCDEPGGGLSSGGDIPCPDCNHEAFLAYALEEIESDGYNRQENRERVYAHQKLHCERVGEAALCEAAWLKGWDEAKAST